MMHPFMAQEIANYTQAEIARTRGQRNWKSLLKPARQISRR